ncbi:hypothetical protein CDL12_09567 [Handroanthus impetiginosus]|uniref:Uncharacterized protein n=1 Tax=Handroanthus impetiginosus TaxID=429701 RepID=A0A2G9HJR9_9LAMI|nr:hypothetical protein CDL12_09567 [Handroanthus impetiginosus]
MGHPNNSRRNDKQQKLPPIIRRRGHGSYFFGRHLRLPDYHPFTAPHSVNLIKGRLQNMVQPPKHRGN